MCARTLGFSVRFHFPPPGFGSDPVTEIVRLARSGAPAGKSMQNPCEILAKIHAKINTKNEHRWAGFIEAQASVVKEGPSA